MILCIRDRGRKIDDQGPKTRQKGSYIFTWDSLGDNGNVVFDKGMCVRNQKRILTNQRVQREDLRIYTVPICFVGLET